MARDQRRPPRHKHKPPTLKADETFAKYLAKKIQQLIQRFGWIGELPPVGVIASDDHCIVNVQLPNAYRGSPTEATVLRVVTEELDNRRMGEPYGFAMITWLDQHQYDRFTRKKFKGKRNKPPESSVAANQALVKQVNRMRAVTNQPGVSQRHPMTRDERYLALREMERSAKGQWPMPTDSTAQVLGDVIIETREQRRKRLRAESAAHEETARARAAQIAAQEGKLSTAAATKDVSEAAERLASTFVDVAGSAKEFQAIMDRMSKNR